MSETQTRAENGYRQVDDLQGYVQGLLDRGTPVHVAEKTARIAARQGTPGEEVISWSAAADGSEVLEKKSVVAVDEKSGESDWIATKVDGQGEPVVDANGHTNDWVITDPTFKRKYEADPERAGIFRPAGGPQRFVQLDEAIHVEQWGSFWNVDAGGWVNITDPKDLYVVSGRDFADMYRIVE